MTRREKVLAICVGGALGGLALAMIVRWTVVEPYKAIQKQITDEQKRQKDLRAELRNLQPVDAKWEELTSRTFSADPQEAQRRFREDMHMLLERHGLKSAKVSPGAFVRYKDESTGVPLTISASGSLKAIVGFLCDFYRRDYLARLDKVRISAEQAVIADVNSTRGRGGGARPGRGGAARREAATGPDGPELKLNVSAVALVLPQLPMMGHPVLPDEIPERERGRLAEDLPAYKTIFERSLFVPYTPRVAAPQPAETTKPAHVAEVPPPPETSKPDPDAQKYVCGTTRLNGELIAYVLDEARRDQRPSEYRLDQPIHDGTLLLVVPEGIVVRANGKDYFYPLGKKFAEREVLDADAHPEVWEAFQRAFLWPEGGPGGRASGPRV